MKQSKENRNQHYVPKCYLRNFSASPKCITTYIYSKKKFIAHAGLDGVASKEFFYGEDLALEKYLQNLEGEWATAFRVLTHEEPISDEEAQRLEYSILLFITIQLNRTLKTANSQLEFKQFLENHIRNYSSSSAHAQHLLEQYIPKNFNPVFIPIDVAVHAVPVLQDLDVMILFNCSEDDFITSDNPVVLYNKFSVYHKCQGNYGLGSRGLCIFLPISPKICLCLFDPKIYYPLDNRYGFEITDKQVVYELNKLFCRNAYDFLFFSDKHDCAYAERLSEYFVDRLDSATSVISSNIGPLIHLSGNSILDYYDLPFLVLKRKALKTHLLPYGPIPARKNFPVPKHT